MHAERKERLLIIGTGVCILALLTGLYVFQPAFLHFLDLKLYDQLLRSRGTREPTGKVVIVDLDERSLAQYGQWPWPRYRVALLLGRLQQAGALSVGLDILLAEPDRTSPAILKSELKRDLGLDVNFSGLPAELEDNDRLLAGLLAQGPYVLSLYFDFLGSGRQADAAHLPPALNLSVARNSKAPPAGGDLLSAASVVPPLPSLSSACRSAGFFNTVSDRDGVIRRLPLLIEYGSRVYPALALATLIEAGGLGSPVLRIGDAGPESLGLGRGIAVPLDPQARVMIDFLGPARTFPTVSAAAVLEGAAPALLDGAVVLVGTSVAGLKDIRTTPYGPDVPGVEVHATVIDNILSGRYITVPDWAPGLELFLLWAAGLCTILCLTFFRPLPIVLPLAALLAGLWWGARWLLEAKGMHISPLHPYLAVGLTFAPLSFVKFWREERRRRFIHGAFSRYVSPAVVGEIMRAPETLTLTGEEKEVSILFSDIRGFTSLSEKLSPTQVTQLLNAYLTPMTRIITAHNGTLDKFIGDAVMAFWNAPLDVPGHQSSAVRAALEMLSKLEELNREFVERFGAPVRIGIGVHCGRVRVGNMGSEDLFDYTLIGDNVNLTSRLEGLTKHYGQQLLVSDEIRSACGDIGVRFVEVDLVRVKGKQHPVRIFTVFGKDREPDWLRGLTRYEQAMGEYRAGRFQEACCLFGELQSEFPDERLFSLYAKRCADLASSATCSGFDGVYTHKEK
jgi:adenylate cyclase